MMNIYKLRYVWYEGDEGYTYIVTKLSRESFENVLRKGIQAINKLTEAEYTIKCLPEGYEKLVAWLEEHNCLVANYNPNYEYFVDDCKDGFTVQRRDESYTWVELCHENKE